MQGATEKYSREKINYYMEIEIIKIGQLSKYSTFVKTTTHSFF